jgi:hypothetical protein
MLILKLLLVISGCGLLAMVAMVIYDIYLALELERLNRRACLVAPARRMHGVVAAHRAIVRVRGGDLRH